MRGACGCYWHDKARAMAARGESDERIAEVFGKSVKWVQKLVADSRLNKRQLWEQKKEQARELRAQGKKVSEIMAITGLAKDTIVRACKGVVCPVNHQIGFQIGHTIRSPRNAKTGVGSRGGSTRLPRVRKPYKPRVLTDADERAIRVKAAINSDKVRIKRDGPAPITLPRVSLQHWNWDEAA